MRVLILVVEQYLITTTISVGAAGAHPMAVALAPVPRIDYSVTKVNVQSDQQEEVGDDSQSYSDLSPKQRRNTKESEDSDIKEDSSEVAAEATADDDDDTEVETALEDQLFAGLRRKIEKNIQRVKEFVKVSFT
ncbi:hypothetical protein ANCCAN_12927 [Ancylostoma caninum]|uniref:Uncharacterized protein n=1 Tax=Ancylostoma caninum TaxID=29170 RepID=A0A368G9R4_ANCCA|nr:hypothetical protein ANCCAN_12927 [Ancylostoma caninum]